MSTKMIETLWRADRIMAGAVALVAIVIGGVAGATIMDRPLLAPVAIEQTVVAQAPQEEASVEDGFILDSATAQLISEHRCLSEALYFEARGEGESGQKAIAEVIFHRLGEKNYPGSICGVVYQGSNNKGCQFSFACNGDMKKAKNRKAWKSAQMLAAQILTGAERMKGLTNRATHFHAISVQPNWADQLHRTIQIGNHIFYRELPRNKRS